MREGDAHSRAHTASHSQFVLRALFLARGTYIIRVTLGGNKRKGKKTSPAFPLPSICCFCSLFFLLYVFLLLLSVFLPLHFLVFSTPLSFSLVAVFSPWCSLPHYTSDSTSSLPFCCSSPFSFSFRHPSSVFLFCNLTSISLCHDTLQP